MLVFIDESGALHPNDPSPRATLCAVCVPEGISRAFNQSLHDLVKTIYPSRDPMEMEIKAEKFLARRPFEYSAERRALVSAVSDLIESTPLAIYAVQMPRPTIVPNWPASMLRPHYRLLMERVELHMRAQEPDGFAKVLFDERDPGADAADSRSFRTFMSTTAEGKSWQHILDTPFFVSSDITPGIQVADLVAGALRHYIQLQDAHSAFTTDWERAVERLSDAARAKSRDFAMAGHTYFGLYFMPERYYAAPPGPRPLRTP